MSARLETSQEWQLFLMQLRYKEGELVILDGNRPFWLVDTSQAWIVYSGGVDVFAVEQDGQTEGAWQPLFRVENNQLLLGFSPEKIRLKARCLPRTQILSISMERLQVLAQQADYRPLVAHLIETWIIQLASTFHADKLPKQRLYVQSSAQFDTETYLTTDDKLRWLKLNTGQAYLLGDIKLSIPQAFFSPLTPSTWWQVEAQSHLNAVSTMEMLAADPQCLGLAHYHNLVLQALEQVQQQAQVDYASLLAHSQAQNQQQMAQAFQDLSGIWAEDKHFSEQAFQNELLSAFQYILKAIGLALKVPLNLDALSFDKAIQELAEASHVQVRRIRLDGDWWQYRFESLLVFHGHRPAALVAGQGRHYFLYSPFLPQGKTRLNKTLARELKAYGYLIYRPFPADKAISLALLLRFGFAKYLPDLSLLLRLTMLATLLNSSLPLITSLIFNDYLPQGKSSQVLLMAVILVLSALGIGLFQFMRGLVFLAIETKSLEGVQTAFWDRLLNLPVDFFRPYSAGDLQERLRGLEQVQKLILGIASQLTLGFFFALFNFFLLLYYDAGLAFYSLSLALLILLFTLITAYRLLRYQRKIRALEGKNATILRQIISGVGKLRVSHAESRAFRFWARLFSQKQRLDYQAGQVQNQYSIGMALYPFVSLIGMFSLMRYQNISLSAGTFLGFYTAFAFFMGACLEIAWALSKIFEVIPLYERLRPILTTLPEHRESREALGELNGSIELSHVTFRYHPNSSPVLNDLSLKIDYGEFVAIVGASGCGKSTLLRLLLGFEKAEAGAIYYDGKALDEIDLKTLRRQMGVVLQNSQVVTGDIYTNIVGSHPLPLSQAWEAAQQAHIAEEINALPMKMHTVVTEGGSTFSGGQRQRLLIARALVTQPRILFLDEATSALDDLAQNQVMNTLKSLSSTRILIAHRLNTLVHVQRIIVMEKGRIVQDGTYQDLIKQEGLFADLVENQMI